MGTLRVTETTTSRLGSVFSTVATDGANLTTSGTAATVSGITLAAGRIYALTTNANSRVTFDGTTAAAENGHALTANSPMVFECDPAHHGNSISAIET